MVAVVDELRAASEPGRLDGSAVLRLVALSVRARGEELLVGDVGAGEFVVLPEIAGVILDGIRAGQPLAAVAETAREVAGQDVDVVDFAKGLIELGFVTHVNDRPVKNDRVRLHDGGRVGERLAALAGPLFSRAAWIVYATLAAGCAVLLLFAPRYRPPANSVFFLHDPLASLAILGVIDAGLTVFHEGAHWLAARVEGVPARITLGRRLYLLVAQTDLTSLFAVPRRRRFGPLLAGLAFEIITLSLLLAAELAAAHGLWHPPATLMRLLMATALFRLNWSIAFQFLVFMRTDLYAVLVIGLDCLQLTRTTRLTIKRALRRLSSDEAAELAAADPRDLQVTRWYRWLYVGGMIAAAWFLIAFALPWLATIAHWITTSLTDTSPTHWRFWESLAFAAITLIPLLIPPTMMVVEQTRRLRQHSATP